MKYNNLKIVYGKELAYQLIGFGFTPIDIQQDKNNKNELVFIFKNSKAIRITIRNLCNNK